MAKSYFTLFSQSAETQYASGALPLMSLARQNQGVRFLVAPAQGDTANTGNQVVVQRTKRVKAVDAPAHTGKAGTDAIALLDTAQKIDWDTVGTKTSTKRSLLVATLPNVEYDILEDAEAYQKPINEMTTNRLFEAEEKALKSVISSTTPVALDITTDAKTVEAIEAEVEKLQLLVDEFKAYSYGIVVLVHPTIARKFAKIQGQSYYQGTNTFPEGFNNGFRYNGVDYFVNPLMNAIETTAGKVAGAIVMDKEAYANQGVENGITQINQVIGDTRFVGHTYRELDIVVDKARITVMEFATTKGKLVNEA